MRFKDLKIGVRMGLGFGLLIVMLLGMMLVSVLRLQEISALTGHIVDNDWAKAEAANVINATTRANGRRTMELVLANDPVHVAGVKAAIELNKKTIGLALETLEVGVDGILFDGKAGEIKRVRGMMDQMSSRAVE